MNVRGKPVKEGRRPPPQAARPPQGVAVLDWLDCFRLIMGKGEGWQQAAGLVLSLP